MNRTVRKTRNNKNRYRIIYYDKKDRRFSDNRMKSFVRMIRKITILTIGNNFNKNPESQLPD